jgi:hypothetical protein
LEDHRKLSELRLSRHEFTVLLNVGSEGRSDLIEFAAIPTRTDTSVLAYDYEARTCKEGGTANFAAFSMGGHYSDPLNF